MGRSRSSSDLPPPSGMTVQQRNAFSSAVFRATQRLLGTVPPFPLTRDEIEEWYGPRHLIDRFREAAAYAPNLVTASTHARIAVHVVPSDASKGKYSIRPTMSHMDAQKLQGFCVPTKKVEGHNPPAKSIEKLREWCALRYKVGTEIGYVRVLFEEAIKHARTANQLWKIWPELFKLSQDREALELLARVSQGVRSHAVEGWTKEHETAVQVANFILAKTALLPDYAGDKSVGKHVVDKVMREGVEPPLTRFGRFIDVP